MTATDASSSSDDDAPIGDAAAQRALAAASTPRIMAFAYSLLAGVVDRAGAASDVAQEVLIVVTSRIANGGFDSVQHLRAFGVGVARHKCADYRRAEARQRGPVADHVGPDPAAELSTAPFVLDLVAADGSTPSSGANRALLFRALVEEMSALPEHYQEALRLFCFAGLNTTEAGRELGLSRTAAANLFVRARTALRERWFVRAGAVAPRRDGRAESEG